MRVVHYINQFFAGIGGEEEALQQPVSREGAVGPGRLLARLLGEDGQVVATVICGDSYFGEHEAAATQGVVDLIGLHQPDLVIAGPAFGSGRYGVACARVVSEVVARGIAPAITAMHEDNPGLGLVDQKHGPVYVVRASVNAAGMRDAMSVCVSLGRNLAAGEAPRPSDLEKVFARGVRRNEMADHNAAERAVLALLEKMEGQSVPTEKLLPVYEKVKPSSLRVGIHDARLALVTEAALVPRGNPDNLESNRARHWYAYSIDGLEELKAGEFVTVHGGCDNQFINENPNRVLPVDALRVLEGKKAIGELFGKYYVTTGATTAVKEAERIGREVAAELRTQQVQAVLVTST